MGKKKSPGVAARRRAGDTARKKAVAIDKKVKSAKGAAAARKRGSSTASKASFAGLISKQLTVGKWRENIKEALRIPGSGGPIRTARQHDDALMRSMDATIKKFHAKSAAHEEASEKRRIVHEASMEAIRKGIWAKEHGPKEHKYWRRYERGK